MISVYLDVDRTLFDTTLFDTLRWALLEKEFGISEAQGRKQQRQFYVYDGDMYTYDFDAHMRAIGLDIDEVYELLSGSELADGRLEYAGVDSLITWIQERGTMKVKLLTFGVNKYQLLKVALCPSIKSLEVITTMNSKGDFFAKHPERAVLLDDKPIGNTLPSQVTFVQSAQYNNLIPSTDAPWLVAHSLDEFRHFLEEGFAL